MSATLEEQLEARRIRGIQIADRMKIKRCGFNYLVPSSSGQSKYEVDPDKGWCQCPDHEERGVVCKHIHAVRIVLERQENADGSVTETVEITERIQRKTYPQDWSAYNKAQVNEKRHFRELLGELTDTVPTVQPARGRRRVPMCDAIFAATYKVYTGFSARRFSTDLKEAHEQGYTSRPLHFNSVLRGMESPKMSWYLTRLIQLSATPLKLVESSFAVDSSGFSTSRFERWYDEKYGALRKRADWVKCHLMCGVRTNIVTAVELGGSSADIVHMPSMLDTTAQFFEMDEVSADKAYLSRQVVKRINEHDATPLIPMKSDSSVKRTDHREWKRIFSHFHYQQEDFLARYHKRSNVESTFSMMKAKFGDSLRSKTDTAMHNEVLCKVLCHNICRVIFAAYSLGVVPEFDRRDLEQPGTLSPCLP